MVTGEQVAKPVADEQHNTASNLPLSRVHSQLESSAIGVSKKL